MAFMASTTPYRRDPNDPGASTPRTFRERARLAIAALGVIGLASAIVIGVSHEGARDDRPDAPPELVDGANVFPGSIADLPMAAPLEPLLTADRPDRLAVLSPREGTLRV